MRCPIGREKVTEDEVLCDRETVKDIALKQTNHTTGNASPHIIDRKSLGTSIVRPRRPCHTGRVKSGSFPLQLCTWTAGPQTEIMENLYQQGKKSEDRGLKWVIEPVV
jgi:hypothetical protein